MSCILILKKKQNKKDNHISKRKTWRQKSEKSHDEI